MFTTKEIINHFIDRFLFSVIYSGPNFPLKFDYPSNHLSEQEAIRFLIGSSMAGNKSIGFFTELPGINDIKTVKSALLILSTELKTGIIMPTLFLKDIDNMTNILITAHNISEETKLPVNIIMSSNSLFSFSTSKIPKIHTSLKKPSLDKYLDKKNLEYKKNSDTILKNMHQAEKTLSKKFENKFVISENVGFNTLDGTFINYLVPETKSLEISALKKLDHINVNEKEYPFVKKLLETNNMHIEIKIVNNESPLKIKPILCPGCPFANITNLLNLENYIIFTDIRCDTINKVYNIFYATFQNFLGLSNNNDNHLCFVGMLSNFTSKFNQFDNPNLIILLKDINMHFKGFKTTSKPYKIKNKNSIFPYSCSNIEHYKKVKIKDHLCKCLDEKTDPICIKKTFCPALYIVNSKVKINRTLCTGCSVCKNICPHGAIS